MVKLSMDMLLFPIYLVVLGMIVYFLGNLWELSVILMLILSITVIHKIFADRDMNEMRKNREKVINVVTEKLDIFSSAVDRIRQDISGHYKTFEEKTSNLERNYTNLTERVIDIENRVHEVRKTLGAAVGSLEERIREEE